MTAKHTKAPLDSKLEAAKSASDWPLLIRMCRQALRKNPPKELAGFKIVRAADYLTHVMYDYTAQNTAAIDLPPANVLTYWLANGASVIVRPSGTEPKIKVYYSTSGASLAEAEALSAKLAAAMAPLVQ